MGVYGYMKNSKWNGKNVLVVGDSLTSDGRRQKRFSELTGANIETHAYGCLGIIEIIDGKTASADKSVCYDPITGTGFEFGPLTKEKIGWADLVILLMGYVSRKGNASRKVCIRAGKDLFVYRRKRKPQPAYNAGLSSLRWKIRLDKCGWLRRISRRKRQEP